MSNYISAQARLTAAIREGVRDFVPQWKNVQEAMSQGLTSMSLAQTERVTVASCFVQGLTDLGYTFTHSTGSCVTAIEAIRGHDAVLITVEDGGTVETDWIGISGGSCSQRQQELTASLRQYGVELGETTHVSHHDPRGGQLVAAAAKHRGTSLVEGAVIEAEAAQRERACAANLYEKHGAQIGQRS